MNSELPVLGNVGYKISLQRVAPGDENRVAAQHVAAITKQGGRPPVCVLKLFGRFDLCTIYQTKDYGDGPSKSGPIEGIRGGNKILAFHWGAASKNRKGEELSIEEGGPVWGLLFFRFNEALAKVYGAKLEMVLAKHWNENKPKHVALDVFGTTGWAELLFVLRGHKFNEVISALGKISEQTVTITGNTGSDTVLAPAKTFSLLGVDFNLVTPSKRASLPDRFPEKYEFGNGVFPILTATCPPGSMQKVYNIGSKRIGPGFVTFGSSDFVFNSSNGTWGKFIYNVLEMRRALSGSLYSTSIGILRAGNDGFGKAIKCNFIQGKRLDITERLAGLFGKWGPNFEGRLRNLYFGLSNLMQDPLTGECFEDMRTLAKTRLPHVLSELSPDDDDDVRLLDDIVEVMAYGADERIHGAFSAIEYLEANLSPTKGGIQRVLTAASAIPKALLSRVKKQWYGFVVSGYQNASFNAHYEVINLPFAKLFKPEEWDGLFHETGHAALFDDEFFDMDSTEVTSMVKKASRSEDEISHAFLDCKNEFYEVGADLFDLYFCYGVDLDEFYSKICPNVVKNAGVLEPRFFTRLFIAFEYCNELLRGRKKRFSSVDVWNDMDRFRRVLRRLNISKTSTRQMEEAAIAGFFALKPGIELLHRRFSQAGPPKDLNKELGNPEILLMIDTILKGRVWSQPIQSPDNLIIALKKRKKELTLAARLAAIMSLWHTVKTNQGAK